MHWMMVCFGIGALSGVITALFGGAGGWFLVPALIAGLPYMGIENPERIKIAIATALAINAVTGIAAARAYAAKGSVHWRALGFMFPGAAIGVIAGAALAARANVTLLAFVFTASAMYMAWKMMRGETGGATHKVLPGFLNLSGKCLAVGGLVGAVGAGGLSVPIFARHMPVTWAIGTASVLSIPLSATAAITYAAAAPPPGCTGGCLGYTDLPVMCATGIAAVLFAPAGSALAHSLPVPVLKRAFAIGLAVASLNLARKNLPPAESFSREAKAVLAGFSWSFSLCRDRGPPKPVRLRGAE